MGRQTGKQAASESQQAERAAAGGRGAPRAHRQLSQTWVTAVLPAPLGCCLRAILPLDPFLEVQERGTRRVPQLIPCAGRPPHTFL